VTEIGPSDWHSGQFHDYVYDVVTWDFAPTFHAVDGLALAARGPIDLLGNR
jgi:hypothetical protein